MRAKACIAVFLLAPGSALAQQEIELYPGRVSFTSRGDNSVNAGETLQGFHASHLQGIGDNGTNATVANLRATIQDQNAATRETFHWVVRSGTDANGPMLGTGAVVFELQAQPPRSTSNSAVAWTLTTSLSKPVELPGADKFFALGVRLSPAALWTRDGMSTHTSFGSVTFPHQGTHTRAEDHAWQIVKNATAAAHPSHKRTWRYGVLVDSGALQAGNGGSMYGMGGMFPLDQKPVTARARYPKDMAAGDSLLFLGTKRVPGIRAFPNTARIVLGGELYFVGSLRIDAAGAANHTIQSTLPSACIGAPRAYIQALGVKGRVIHATNSFAINP